jgi:hypothetical protein
VKSWRTIRATTKGISRVRSAVGCHARERADVGFGDALAVEVAQDRLEDDAELTGAVRSRRARRLELRERVSSASLCGPPPSEELPGAESNSACRAHGTGLTPEPDAAPHSRRGRNHPRICREEKPHSRPRDEFGDIPAGTSRLHRVESRERRTEPYRRNIVFRGARLHRVGSRAELRSVVRKTQSEVRRGQIETNARVTRTRPIARVATPPRVPSIPAERKQHPFRSSRALEALAGCRKSPTGSDVRGRPEREHAATCARSMSPTPCLLGDAPRCRASVVPRIGSAQRRAELSGGSGRGDSSAPARIF